MEKEFQYTHWMNADQDKEKEINQAFRFRGYGTMFAYVAILIVFIGLIVYNLMLEKPSLPFTAIFCLLSLACFAGLTNQLKVIRKMKSTKWQYRDAILVSVHKEGKIPHRVLRIEAKVKENNVKKTILFIKTYSKIKLQMNQRVMLVRPVNGTDIYVYQKLCNVVSEYEENV